jgi:O-6-methylguanine DNA methyltransferase
VRKPPEPPVSLRARVIGIVRSIPAGRVATYGDVAEWAGAPGAARAVGHIMATSGGQDAPCHRVVGAGGQLGGYGGQEAIKRALLQAEGVRVSGRRIRAFGEARWTGPKRATLRRP